MYHILYLFYLFLYLFYFFTYLSISLSILLLMEVWIPSTLVILQILILFDIS